MAFRQSPTLVPYEIAVAEMESRVAAIQAEKADELLWFLEHPPSYTAGTSAKDGDLIDPDRFPVYQTGRGGEYTYHGPGQRVAYVILDLRRMKRDVRAYVRALEEWLIATLKHFDIQGECYTGRVGIWVKHGCDSKASNLSPEYKIGALGVRVRKWIAFHGIALNVAPDLDHFSGIVPCGVSQHGVTSLKALGKDTNMHAVDEALRIEFERTFDVTLKDEKV
ncbi:MAG: lipoyl(octanoyl) transferase LipB [Rhodospirillaceae bacterium]